MTDTTICGMINACGIAGAAILGAAIPLVSKWWSERSAAQIKEKQTEVELSQKEKDHDVAIWREYCNKLVCDMKSVSDHSDKVMKDWLASREEVFQLKAEITVLKKELEKSTPPKSA